MVKVKRSAPMSRLQVVQTHQILKDITTPVGDGFFEYKDGWTDEKAAEKIGCTHWVLRKLRGELGFKFKRGDFLAIAHEYSAQYVSRIEALERKNQELTDRFNRLVEILQLNHFVDVKHLKIQ